MNCLNCNKELEQIKGKRERKFCNSTCRSNFWQKENRKNKLPLPKDYVEMKDIRISENILHTDTIKENIEVIDNSEIEKQIAEIKEEKIPAERDTPFGKKIWSAEQEKRIVELKNKLK